MIAVRIHWHTYADGSPVPHETAMADRPHSFYGPFRDITAAISWIENDYPDGDEDVYEIVADDFDIPPHAAWLNAPESIFGDDPDEDVRDYVDESPEQFREKYKH